jgi:hypothetical protein
MGGFRVFLLWVGCIIVGGVIGFAIGYIIWQLGFEMLGSATAMIGSVVGGTMAFFGVYAWSERRQAARRRKERSRVQS